jgi:hypothetical protein
MLLAVARLIGSSGEALRVSCPQIMHFVRASILLQPVHRAKALTSVGCLNAGRRLDRLGGPDTLASSSASHRIAAD